MSGSSLDDLLGLRSAKRMVRSLLRTQGAAHAVILHGGEGAGKTSLARFLARAWLCPNRTADGGCGSCSICLMFDRGNCSDLLVVEPQGASRIIRLNQIHPTKASEPPPHVPIQIFLRTRPMAASMKVVLIEDADRMNGDAANAMLKTLEEPHSYAKLILTTESVGSLLPTILSRCLLIGCPYPDEKDLRARFADFSEDQLAFTGGSVGEAMRVSAAPEAAANLGAFASRLRERPVAEALVAADEFKALCAAAGESDGAGARAAQAETLKALARYIMKSETARPEWVHAIVETHRRIVGNANAGPAFDALFTHMLLRR